MAIAFTKTGQPEEAIRHYKRALELDDPASVGAHYGVAFLLLKRGDAQQAAEHLRAFLARPPKGPDAERWVRHAETRAARHRRQPGAGDAVSAACAPCCWSWRSLGCSGLDEGDGRRGRHRGDRARSGRRSRWASRCSSPPGRSTSNGDSVATPVVWRSADAAASVDRRDGRGHRRVARHRAGCRRRSGSLASSVITFTVDRAGRHDPHRGRLGAGRRHRRRRSPAAMTISLESLHPPGAVGGRGRSSSPSPRPIRPPARPRSRSSTAAWSTRSPPATHRRGRGFAGGRGRHRRRRTPSSSRCARSGPGAGSCPARASASSSISRRRRPHAAHADRALLRCAGGVRRPAGRHARSSGTAAGSPLSYAGAGRAGAGR